MQPATQVAIIAGGALSAYIMGRLTPQPIPLPTEVTAVKDSTNSTQQVSVDEDVYRLYVQTPPIEATEPEVYCPWNLNTAKDLDFDLIQMITKQSLSHQLEESCDIAKQKALQIGKWGFPSCSNLRFYDSYCSSINYYRSNPNWCGEYLSRDDLDINAEVERKKSPGFYEDDTVPEKFRSLLQDFRRSGFSRGHLVPAGDHNSCQKNKDLTFRLTSNVVPQEMSMNGCDWLRVERFAKTLIVSNETDIEKCWIFTGPVYKPIYDDNDHSYSRPTMITNAETGEDEEIVKVYNRPKKRGKLEHECVGKTMVHVPTHLFKVILAERGGDDEESDTEINVEKYQLAAFMVQNEAIHDKVPLSDYLVDIDELEHWVGLEFFPKLRNSEVPYGELCKNYKCKYEDDERTTGWRGLGEIKSAKTLSELEGAWDEAQQKEYDADWILGLYRRAYYYRQRELIEPIQDRINSMRLFQ